MAEKASFFGAVVGVVLCISAFLLLIIYYQNNLASNKLTISTKQIIARFQKSLPLKFDEGLFLVKYKIQQDSIIFTFRFDERGILQQFIPDVKNLLAHNANRWVCSLRDSLPPDAPDFSVKVIFVGWQGEDFTQLENRRNDCTINYQSEEQFL